jgi:hypothetical protein
MEMKNRYCPNIHLGGLREYFGDPTWEIHIQTHRLVGGIYEVRR